MSRFILIFLALPLFEWSTLLAEEINTRNYVVGTYDATINEARIAEVRAWRYWLKNRERLGERGHYLAVTTATVMPGDIVQVLWHNMINTQAGAGFLLPSAWNPGRMRCVMIYDTQSARFATEHGFLVIETPHRGTLARFGDYIALYIDTGSFW